MNAKVKLSREELRVILCNHAEWLKGSSKGARTNLSRANLSRANLYRADLSGADLSGANLSGANLSGANFENATFVKGWKIVKI